MTHIPGGSRNIARTGAGPSASAVSAPDLTLLLLLRHFFHHAHTLHAHEYGGLRESNAQLLKRAHTMVA